MRFAIIEDTQEDCMLLLTLLKQYMAHYDFTSEFSLFTSGEDFLANVQPDLYDLCFMDIFMDGMNGVQTAEALRQIDPSCLVIFLTTSPDFFADGFRLRAWRYLLKPITPEQLAEALDAGADIIMLDNMSYDLMRECVGLVAGRALVEASGNMGAKNLREVAETGVDIISIGALTHTVKAADISLKFQIS